MHTPSVCGRPNASSSARAFTLVELVTAASIMTIIMIGVVEIFAVVTQTATEAEAIHGAHQQMRATLDRLNRDLRGITREGPLQISTALPTGGDSKYHSDALAFVSVGRHFGTYNPQTCRAGAAVVLYTTNVETPPNFNTTDHYFLKLKVGAEDQNLDYRRGVLARSTWLMSGTDDSPSLPLEQKDTFKFEWLGKLFGSADNALPVGPTKVIPFLPATGASPNQTVRRVMTTGTSEFSVEYWDNASSDWKKNETKTFSPGSERPRAVRVTLAVHDPDERGPLPAGKNRYEGYALQEAFWLGNP